jgi:6-phosphofructokinase 2
MSPIITLTLNPALDLTTSIDHLVPSEKMRCAVPRHDPGGGGINVARAIHALGGEALAVFPAGGPTGALIESLLAAESVPCRRIPIAGLTRENLAVDEHGSGKQFRFVMPGPVLSAEELQACMAALAAIRPKPAYLVASGSLPPGCPDTFYGTVIDWAAANDVKLVLDTSGPALAIVREKPVFLLKPSRTELEHLVGHPLTGRDEIAVAARNLIAHGRAGIVVVSLGPEGALLATTEGCAGFPAPRIATRSTVGAGDSMVAGMILAIARGRPLDEAVRLGIAAGAAASLNPGTTLCRRADVEGLFGAEIPAS